jgi:hypothetical protein
MQINAAAAPLKLSTPVLVRGEGHTLQYISLRIALSATRWGLRCVTFEQARAIRADAVIVTAIFSIPCALSVCAFSYWGLARAAPALLPWQPRREAFFKNFYFFCRWIQGKSISKAAVEGGLRCQGEGKTSCTIKPAPYSRRNGVELCSVRLEITNSVLRIVFYLFLRN